MFYLNALCFMLGCWQAEAQIYDTNNDTVQTFAGSGFTGYLDGQGTQTMWSAPSSIVADSSGNLFVWDSGNHRVRKITPAGAVSTFVGGGPSALQGYGTNVWFSYQLVSPMVMDHSNGVWMVGYNSGNYFLLKIGSDSYVSVENVNLPGLSFNNAPCVDSANNLYYTDSTHVYRYFPTNGTYEIFVGSGNGGLVDGNGIFSSFSSAGALTADAADNLYVNDSGLIRRVSQNRDVVTIAGGGSGDGVGRSAGIGSLSAICMDQSGNIIFAGSTANGTSIRKMTATTNVITLAGSFSQYGYTNGPGYLARFFQAYGVCVSQGAIFVTDSGNQRIRNITFNPVPQPVSGGSLSLSTYAGLKLTGVIGRSYQIQSSTNMTNWQDETTIFLTASPYLWIDQNGLGKKKFYRAFLLP